MTKELQSEKKRKILAQRAKILARETDQTQAAEESIEVIEFHLAHEKYAIEMVYLREVYSLKELTPLPGAPSFVLGIINVRGQIVSVLDIKRFFNLPEKGLASFNKVLVLDLLGLEIGILTDDIVGNRAIPISAIQPPLPTLTGISGEYLKGVTSEPLIILDMAKIGADKRIIVNDQVGF